MCIRYAPLRIVVTTLPELYILGDLGKTIMK